jgi:N-acylneuraminate cytidylyltransferase/CMP-N,N'-diacetyllegionaminic acid synthase
LLGKPLIAWTIEQAKATGLFELVAVSSDDAKILEAARRWGADLAIARPDDLATDTAPKLGAIRHCLEEVSRRQRMSFDVLVDLDATSPLRQSSDIAGAIALLETSGTTNVITGAEARRSPYFNLVELQGDGSVRLAKIPERPINRRQDSPQCFDMNASIYVWRVQEFLRQPAVFYRDTRLFVMPHDRSVDIDSELDFEIVELLMRRRAAAGTAA